MMNMGDTTTSTMDMVMTSTSSMSMSMSTSTSTSMDMSSDSMSMNTYLTTSFKDYPVIFKGLKSNSNASAFGIFCVLFFSAIAMKGCFFLSAYLEQKVFHTYSDISCNSNLNSNSNSNSNEKSCCNEDTILDTNSSSTFQLINKKSTIRQLLFPGWGELYKDLIRLIITFIAAILGYALMLGAMSFIVLYFFAICLGIAFGEVFWNRVAIVLGVNQSVTLCGNLH